MSSPLTAAEIVLAQVAEDTSDFGNRVTSVFVGEFPGALVGHPNAHRHHTLPYITVPLGLLAHYALGLDPKDWSA